MYTQEIHFNFKSNSMSFSDITGTQDNNPLPIYTLIAMLPWQWHDTDSQWPEKQETLKHIFYNPIANRRYITYKIHQL